MVRLPQRPREHILDDESRQFIRQMFPSEWIIENGYKDYGIDLVVEIVINGNVSGAHFLLQLKGTDSLEILKSGYISYSCNTSTLQYFLQRTELVIFSIYDSKEKVGYWIWIQDFIRNNLKTDWCNQITATIRIPMQYKLDQKAVKEIEQRVLKAHGQNLWLTAIQTIQNPYVGYRISALDEESVKIEAYGKYPGALDDHPVELSGIFKFDQSQEAQEARKALENAFKTGETVKLDSRYFEGFDPAQIAPDLLAHLGKFETREIEIGTAQTNEGFIGKLEILDEHDNNLGEIPYIDFRVVQAGSEETTLSNEHQPIPLKVKWILNYVKQISTFNFRFYFAGSNVLEIQKFLKFSLATKNGRWFQITNLTTGFSFKESLPKDINLELADDFCEMIDDLALIQKKTGQLIQFPETITIAERRKMKVLVEVLTYGSIRTNALKYTFTLPIDAALKLASAYEKSIITKWQFGNPESKLHFMGMDLDLGPRSIILPSATLEPDTQQKLLELKALPGNATVDISLDVGDLGIITYFTKWLPT
ncbi:MAG: hypothetical protein C3F13_16455 [Anaerolineales bacterium]|nr:MAG: hypothetical protein C3F13_16455 [Anaerolineales bacterium]